MPSPVVVITGASQGIGAAIAREFAREVRGVRLALLARNEKNLRRVAAACDKLGARSRVVVCDATNEESVAAAAKAVGPADVLINNAGRFVGRSFLEITTEEFDELIAANLRSMFLVSKAFVPAMVKMKRGHVFNMSSVAGLQSYPGGAGYCPAKFGVTGLTNVMRDELREHSIQVTGIFPGATFTPSWNGSGVPASRMMPAKSIARAIVNAWKLGPGTVIEEIILRPPQGDL
jgi:NADP-dependent 3-hydroxy acid dehydrogenase YdfG